MFSSPSLAFPVACLTCVVNYQVPKEWMLDPDWDMEPKEPLQMSHTRRFPSKWRAASGWSDPTSVVRVVDQFVIPRTPVDPLSPDSAS